MIEWLFIAEYRDYGGGLVYSNNDKGTPYGYIWMRSERDRFWIFQVEDFNDKLVLS